MADDSRSGHTVRGRAPGDPDRHAPRQWIYENLTPWRIHACFTADGELVPRTQGDDGADEPRRVRPALRGVRGQGAVHPRPRRGQGARRGRPPAEHAPHAPPGSDRGAAGAERAAGQPAQGDRDLRMARRRPLSSARGRCSSEAPARCRGRGSSRPWSPFPSSRLLVARSARSCSTVASAATGPSRARTIRRPRPPIAVRRSDDGVDQSLEGIERGSRIRTFVDGVPRHAAEVAILIGAVVVSVIGLGVAIHLTTQLNDLLPIDYGALFRLDNPFATSASWPAAARRSGSSSSVTSPSGCSSPSRR